MSANAGSAQWQAGDARGSRKPGEAAGDFGHLASRHPRTLTPPKRLQTLDVQCQARRVPSRLGQAPHAEAPESKNFLGH